MRSTTLLSVISSLAAAFPAPQPTNGTQAAESEAPLVDANSTEVFYLLGMLLALGCSALGFYAYRQAAHHPITPALLRQIEVVTNPLAANNASPDTDTSLIPTRHSH